ncbi:Structural maintenance of chromosomes protein 2 [Rhizopus stolonifer]|uniref:Structural maintenance of chromosomes protein n=1 Tax=Rhizopus stolonifer TaxID=4846 RepID=A0A367KY45_RHIST|nr:Structural maintenance of chromosomes protein 2 [Rhizopus stolonifer]
MYLEELLIEGFKSYVSRTQITGWDPEFNAITGLNGSGKSNILDAICFVLGITNLSQVRASNLQDLIYKRGQAGVTKASVTIVFNNEDRDKSPVGFEAYKQITVTRQVLMGGRTKYIVNGHNAQQQTVQNLFQSVQLNINNPHFLIMQGRITKVLNMRPTEILSMVEEAAGTKMFEDRKNKALATMTKKERKVEEINTLLMEDIIPKLDRLRAEKRVYLDFQKNEAEMERLNRFVISYEYKKHEERLNKSGADTEARQAKMKELTEAVETIEHELATLLEQKRAMSDKMEKNSSAGIQQLEQQIKQYATQIVRLNTKRDLLASSTTDEQKSLSLLATQRGELDQQIRKKREYYQRIHQEYEAFKKDYDEKQDEMKQTDELIQTLTTGISAEEGHENGYLQQLQQSKHAVHQASTLEEQTMLKMKHLHHELSEKEPQAAKAFAESEGSMVALEQKKQEIETLQTRLDALAWDPTVEQDLLKKKKEAQDTLNDLYDQQESLRRKLTHLDFQYTNPTPDFDRSKVKGLVAELVHLDQSYADASTALEICAGGKLFHVVVQDEKVGAQLLDHGKLKRRWTLIPLNKIQGQPVSDKKLAAAQAMAPGKVDLALCLVGYEEEVYQAMAWIFGNTFICEDAKTAKEVTFHPQIRVKSVTLEGDVYDPHGTLSGGSKPHSAGILMHLQTLNKVRQDIQYHKNVLQALEEEMKASQKSMAEYRHAKQRLDLKMHELALVEQRMRQSTHAQLAARVQALKEQIEKQTQMMEQAKRDKSKALEACSRIEQEMADFNSNKDTKLDEMTMRVEQLKSQLKKSAVKLKDMERSVQTCELEIEQMESDITTCEEEMQKVRESITEYKASTASITEEIQHMEDALAESNQALEQENQVLNAQNEEFNELSVIHDRKSAELVEFNLRIQKLNHENDRFFKERQHSEQAIRDLEQQYEWIVDEKQMFGQPGSAYDYHTIHLADARKQLQQLSANHDTMRKKINVRVMNMIDNVEKKEASLKEMLSTVQKDKQKIEDTIQTLENYKLEALEKTYTKVNKDFAEIFGDLLDGNTCKLQAPEGKTISEGLEVKVCLGGVWKQSLTELSGGQRSLIALSLILSLLQFKPAPMYILDEVDAALDLSHTQNIGSLLRTRFKGSQFLVVSLKDGMFNNANVLFKTRFKDGTSVVERTTPFRKETDESGSRKRGRSTK